MLLCFPVTMVTRLADWQIELFHEARTRLSVPSALARFSSPLSRFALYSLTAESAAIHGFVSASGTAVVGVA
jgi:hypothetical protein